MRWFLVALTLVFLAGCGNVEWFPDSTATSTGSSGDSPNAFSFDPKFISYANAGVNNPVESEAVPITGNNANGWALTVVDTPAKASSELEVGGVYYARSDSGLGSITVKPGDTVKIYQRASTTVGETVTTTVYIGNSHADFKTTTTAN